MFTVLAQNNPIGDTGSTLFDVITRVFAQGDALAQPSKLVEALQDMSIVWAMVFLVVGILCLFNGYRYYKVATVLLALLIGAFCGYAMGKHIGAQWIVAGCMAALLGTICFPLMKYAVALMGGLTGAYFGANVWSAVAHLVVEPEHAAIGNYWIGAMLGLVVFGMLSFVLFKLSIIFFTSISGSTIAVLGLIALLLQFPNFHDSVEGGLSAHAAVIPLLVGVPAAIGLILQQTSPNNRPQPAA